MPLLQVVAGTTIYDEPNQVRDAMYGGNFKTFAFKTRLKKLSPTS